jgi:hypothetical protein
MRLTTDGFSKPSQAIHREWLYCTVFVVLREELRGEAAQRLDGTRCCRTARPRTSTSTREDRHDRSWRTSRASSPSSSSARSFTDGSTCALDIDLDYHLRRVRVRAPGDVPSSSTSAGRSGQRRAAAAKAYVGDMFSRRAAAAIRTYLSGRMGTTKPVRRSVDASSLESFKRSKTRLRRLMNQPRSGSRRWRLSSVSACCMTSRTWASTATISGCSPNRAATSIGSRI